MVQGGPQKSSIIILGNGIRLIVADNRCKGRQKDHGYDDDKANHSQLAPSEAFPYLSRTALFLPVFLNCVRLQVVVWHV